MTINSISGGKTSSFMALEFPANHNVFSLVELDFYKRENRFDRTYEKAYDFIRSKVGDYFFATAEDDRTLECLRLLSNEMEQKQGYSNLNIVTARMFSGGLNFDTLIEKGFLPNSQRRICTEKLKIEPIYRWTRFQTSETVKMRIGFRLDEMERTERLYFKVVPIKNRVPNPNFDMHDFIQRHKIPDYIVIIWDRLLTVESRVREGVITPKPRPFNCFGNDFYRVPEFPLIENKVTNADIIKYWKGKPEYDFPEISNCIGCFHHTIRQLQKQYQINRDKMLWFEGYEGKHTFRKEMSYKTISTLPLQSEFDFTDYGYCDTGGCTD